MWKAIGCEAQGRSHITNGIPCQDRVSIKSKEDGIAVALADGAGSARLSHCGAEYITDYITDEIYSDFETIYNDDDGRNVKVQLMEKVTNVLQNLAIKLECAVKDLSSTLLVVVIKDNRFLLLHLGDGVIGYSKNQDIKVATHPINGEFSNETYFTTSRDAINALRIAKGGLNEIEGFVLMSDGTENSLYSKKHKSLTPTVRKLLQNCAWFSDYVATNNLRLVMEELFVQNTFDDCSMVVIVDSAKYINQFCCSFAEKASLYKVSLTDNNAKRRIKKYDEVLLILTKANTINELTRKLHISKRAARKKVEKLKMLGLISKVNGKYISSQYV